MSSENISWNCWLRCLLACGGAIVSDIFIGICEAQSAVLLPRLEEPDSSIHISKDEATWIASLGVFATPVSSILCGPCIDYFGRKVVIQWYYLTAAIGFGIIGAATSVTHIYIGRILISIAGGFHVASFVYIAEICTTRQRSLCMWLLVDMFVGGILVAYLVAAVLPWNLGSALYALLCLLFVLYVWFTPESPHWLVKKGRTDCAVAQLKRLGHDDTYIDEELKILKTKCQEEINHKIDWHTFAQPTVWKPFLILCLFHFLQSATGTYDLLYYTVDIFDELGTNFDPFLVSAGLATARFVLTVTVGWYFMTKTKRKTATAVSGFSTGIALLVAAAYEYRYSGVPSSQRPKTWIPILAVTASVLVSSVSVNPLPWTMSAEVFPLHVRGTMGGAICFVGTVTVFIFLKSYGFFIETFKVTGFLLFCALASIAVGLFGVFILTETQSKTLHEIELLACGGAITIDLFFGICEAQTAVLLPQLRKSDSSIKVSEDEATWIASLGVFATPVSSILCGPCIDFFGRKIIIQCYYLISALGFGIIAVATSVTHLYVGRIMCSVGNGFHVASFVYISEVCTARQRNLCIYLRLDMFVSGILLTYLVAAILPWNLGSALYALLSFLLMFYVWFTPESPQWLVKKGHTDCATAELKRLGYDDTYIAEEVNILQKKSQGEVNRMINLRTFLQPTVWKPFLIMCLFHFLQAATGIYDLLHYTVDFIGELGTEYDPFLVSLGLATARFVTTISIGWYFADKVRRKTAVAVSGFSMGVSLLIAATYEWRYDAVPPTERPNTWVPILAVLTSVVVCHVGVNALPWTMTAEVFPLHVRGTMGGAVFFVGSISVFLFLKSYGFFIETFKVAGYLLFCAVASVAAGLFGVFILTETQNKSLHEIEASYETKTKLRNAVMEKARF